MTSQSEFDSSRPHLAPPTQRSGLMIQEVNGVPGFDCVGLSMFWLRNAHSEAVINTHKTSSSESPSLSWGFSRPISIGGILLSLERTKLRKKNIGDYIIHNKLLFYRGVLTFMNSRLPLTPNDTVLFSPTVLFCPLVHIFHSSFISYLK